MQKELDEKELLEILALAKEAEQKAREMCDSIATHAQKWQKRVAEKQVAGQNTQNTIEH